MGKRYWMQRAVGASLRAMRLEAGLTQEGCGELVYGVGGSSRVQRVSRVERGVVGISLDDLEAYADKLGYVVSVHFSKKDVRVVDDVRRVRRK